MSDKENYLSSLSKITSGLKVNEPVLKQTQLASKVTSGLPKSVLTTKSAIPSSFEQAIATPRLKVPRTITNLNREYKDFDIEALVALKKRVRGLDVYNEGASDVLSDTEDALQRFIDEHRKLKELNSEQYRQITIKKAELELEHENHALKLAAKDAESNLDSKYDWKAKWRHLFIKSLGTALFITLLLFVGWLVKTYEWAELPYSALFKSVVPLPKP
ncbi:hypothetical protein A165_01530 [Vibrio tasmaniensis ZS-17]|uniref:hypothetical protein n=1 Tax=Vibrio tasmaniensis TaxID=212663 RepID=UPI000304465B|nr:hypothetical protein [Vibrio tasmaniensis]OED63688.1 hypothetical protein A165_01530 [Vibrio tasmaniensis ZS-17]